MAGAGTRGGSSKLASAFARGLKFRRMASRAPSLGRPRQTRLLRSIEDRAMTMPKLGNTTRRRLRIARDGHAQRRHLRG